MLEGPKAPRDAVAKKSGFYICRQKMVAGNVQPDGTGIQYIYLNDVRLTTFARMNGNITDEEILELLRSAEGFRKLVAGIGVTIETDCGEQQLGFVFQMYGRTDPNHSGTVLRVPVRTDGMEQVIWLDDYEWSEDDAIPGQMRFEFPKEGELATVDVKLYVRDGFQVPEQEEINLPDPDSEAYRQIVEASLCRMGNNHRLKAVLDKAKRGESVTLGFIGGSITQGAGAIPIHMECYPNKTYEKFSERFCKGECALIKAGVGGTPSELGMVRFERDVLREGSAKPDLIVVEYAVNDEGDETKGECYESLVRRILALPWHPAVILIFMVFANDWNLQERLLPVGEAYHLPVVSMSDAVVAQFYKSRSEGRVFTKSQYFYDSYHPSNAGHSLIADCLIHLMEQADKQETEEESDWQKTEPVYGAGFENIRLLDKHTGADAAEIECGSFRGTDTVLQCVEMDRNFAPAGEFPYNWMHVSGSEPFRMRIKCTGLVMVSKDSGELKVGKAVVRVDGSEVLTADPHVNGWVHCNAQILFREWEDKEHLVEISMAPGEEEKEFTILGFGYVAS